MSVRLAIPSPAVRVALARREWAATLHAALDADAAGHVDELVLVDVMAVTSALRLARGLAEIAGRES